MSKITRRGLFVGAAALTLAACAPVPSNQRNSRTIHHIFGATAISGSPKRVVCVGLAAQDICMQLGLAPVGMSVFGWVGAQITPWFEDLQREHLAPLPVLLDEDLNSRTIQTIAEIQPDLILAVNSGITQSEYDTLSRIAPVVARPSDKWNTPWEQSVRMTTEAIGKSNSADGIIAKTKQQVAQLRNTYEPPVHLTGLYIESTGLGGADVRVFGEDSNQMKALKLYGLDAPEGWANINNKVMTEQAFRSLAVELVVCQVPAELREEVLREGKLAKRLGRTNEDMIFIPANADGFALYESSPASISWLGRSLIPQMARTEYAQEPVRL